MRLVELPESECMTLVKECSVGRVGVVREGKPLILPVNYVVDNSTVVIRVEEGSILADAAMTPVVFEVDVIDKASRHGWSVLIQGRANNITSTIDAHSEKLRTLIVWPWAPGDKAVWMSIEPRRVTGRRLG